MQINGIDKNKCTGCQECVRECPVRLYSLNRQAGKPEVIFQDPTSSCLHCGHCMAVCPVDAVLYTAKAEDAPVYPDEAGSGADYQSLKKLFARRRSVRRFKEQPVAPAGLSAVLQAMQHAPSASNARKWEFIVITDASTRQYLTAATVRYFKIFRKLLRLHWLIRPFLSLPLRKMVANPAIRRSLDRALAEYEQGEDIILFHAPCVVVLHAAGAGLLAGNDAGIILTQGMLAAESLGLGSCWIGFLQEAFRMSKKLRRFLAIPAHHQVQGVLVLGYPAVRFHRTPPHKELKVRYV